MGFISINSLISFDASTDAILHEVAPKMPMTTTSSTVATPGFTASAWQALERAAVKRRSAATVLRLLARLTQPLAPAAADPRRHAPPVARLPALAPAGRPLVVDAPFEQWAALTDAYAEQFLRMQRGEPRAREEAMRLSREMLRMNEEMNCRA